jgi:hypothetical protein
MSQTKAQLIEGSATSELTAAKTLLGVGSASAPSLTVSGDTNTGIYFPTADTIGFAEGGVEAARIDSSGRLLVGTSNATAYLGASAKSYITDQGGTTIPLALETFRSDSVGSYFVLSKSRATTAGTFTVVQAGDSLGNIIFNGADGSNLNSTGAQIAAIVDGTPGANDMPGRLVFSTTADGASSPTERMRIKNNGRITVGDSGVHGTAYSLKLVAGTDGNAGRYFGIGDALNEGLNALSRDSGTSSYTHIAFNNGNGTCGSITTSGTSTAYNTSSDYRLKENVVLLTGAIDRLQQIPVHRFNFIADPDKTVDGFLAHEAQEIVPECVTGTKDKTKLVSAVLATDGSLLAQGITESEWESEKIEDEEGNSRFPSDSQWVDEYEVPVYQGIDQSKLVPLLTAALQEAIGRIETLEAEVSALKGA